MPPETGSSTERTSGTLELFYAGCGDFAEFRANLCFIYAIRVGMMCCPMEITHWPREEFGYSKTDELETPKMGSSERTWVSYLNTIDGNTGIR